MTEPDSPTPPPSSPPSPPPAKGRGPTLWTAAAVAAGAVASAGRAAVLWAGSAGHLLFPRVCLSCGEADASGDGVLCRACRAEMGRLRRSDYCPDCGRSVGPYGSKSPCARCPERSPLSAIIRVAEYQPPLSKLITSLKYGGREELAATLGDWMARAWRKSGRPAPDAVTAVPMHWRRRLARGYNQADRLAAEAARRLGVPVRADLVRDRDTPQQAKLGAADRRRNVEGAFAVARSASPRGRRYLLVDDVTTTGATAAEAARTLKRAGAAEVCLLAAAIADLPIDPPSAG